MQFSSNFGFDFDPTDGVNPNTFDFIGVAIHEIGHALGFVSGVDYYDAYGRPNGPGRTQANFNFNTTSWFSALDMFRYSTDVNNIAPGTGPVLDLSVTRAATIAAGGNPYFSIDGGLTQLFGDSRFATGYYNGDGDQASHWKDAPGCSGQIGIMDPTFCYQQTGEVSALDIAAFDAMGWNVSFDVIANSGYKRTSSQNLQPVLRGSGADELGDDDLGLRLRRRRHASSPAGSGHRAAGLNVKEGPGRIAWPGPSFFRSGKISVGERAHIGAVGIGDAEPVAVDRPPHLQGARRRHDAVGLVRGMDRILLRQPAMR